MKWTNLIVTYQAAWSDILILAEINSLIDIRLYILGKSLHSIQYKLWVAIKLNADPPTQLKGNWILALEKNVRFDRGHGGNKFVI